MYDQWIARHNLDELEVRVAGQGPDGALFWDQAGTLMSKGWATYPDGWTHPDPQAVAERLWAEHQQLDRSAGITRDETGAIKRTT
jgi:hypothetical protein